MKLIVDSGSTKTAWRLWLGGTRFHDVETVGINPVRDDLASIQRVVGLVARGFESDLLLPSGAPFSTAAVDEVFFYGAGCIAPYSESVWCCLSDAFPQAKVSVESDLLGAARALCGREEGIACILGTGSNSCLYDGERIVENVSPLGWILGDEGSGAVLGRLFVGNVLKRQFHPALCRSFLKYHRLTLEEIIERVYRQPQANRFLASFVPFIANVQDDHDVRKFLLREFRNFFKRNVAGYKRPDLPVNFVGGVAGAFEKILKEAAERERFIFGIVERSPIERICSYHIDLPAAE
ncbi:MAG: ATPase [Bacteroidaceae bacterium]|nr:ATPase [Bacteroidaceae bacterium]